MLILFNYANLENVSYKYLNEKFSICYLYQKSDKINQTNDGKVKRGGSY